MRAVEAVTPAGPILLFEDGSVYLNGRPYTLPAGSTYYGVGRIGGSGVRVYWQDTAGYHSCAPDGSARVNHETLDTARITPRMPNDARDIEKPL